MHGEVVHFTVVDVGGEMDLHRVLRILGQHPQPAPLVSRAASPRYAAFPAPLEVAPDPALLGPAPAGASLEVRVHAVGAIAVRIRVPFEVERLEDVPGVAAKARLGALGLPEAGRELCERTRRDVASAAVEPYDVGVEPETYQVYCLTGGAPTPAELLTQTRDALGAIVAGEQPGRMATAAVEDALKHTVRYYKDDAVIVGWEQAIVVGAPDTYEDVLDVMELANLELLEFRTYDAYIDRRLDEAFDALDRLWARGGLLRSARDALADISELRVDFARLTDNLHDTGKLFGEWYLAKVHQRLRDRFHLGDWERAVASKMETLEDMFQLAEEEANHRRALILESMIVLLFILDLAALVVLAR